MDNIELYSSGPVYALNQYIWKILQEKLEWTTINGAVPVTAAGDPPQFHNYNQPYLTYAYSAETVSESFWNNIEVVTYTVFAQSVKETNAATTLINRALRRFDESATDVNYWIRQYPVFQGVHFQWTQVLNTKSADPSAVQGEKTDGLISIRYAFTAPMFENEFRYRA